MGKIANTFLGYNHSEWVASYTEEDLMEQRELTESEEKRFSENVARVLRQRGRSLDCLTHLSTPEGGSALEQMMEIGYKDWEKTERRRLTGPDVICVPDLSAKDLLKMVVDERAVTFLLDAYKKWNYYRDQYGGIVPGRRKRFEVMVWRPELESERKKITSREAEKYFKLRGFYGHVGAFIEWRRVCGLLGQYATIPPADECYFSQYARRIRKVPSFNFQAIDPGPSDMIDTRRLSLEPFDCVWTSGVGFVGFRSLSDGSSLGQ